MHHIPLEGCPNLWDIGGFRTAEGLYIRTGRIYRSGRLSGLTDSDLMVFSKLGITSLVDFRSGDEIADHPDRLPPGDCCRQVNISLGSGGLSKEQVAMVLKRASLGELDTHEHMIREYREFPLELAPGLKGFFRLLGREDTFPLLMHCTAGKDRTGFTTAVLLGMLGCSEEQIIQGYTRYHRKNLDADALRYAASYRSYGIELTAKQVHPYLVAREEYIRSALASIHMQWKDIPGYLEEAAGVCSELQQRIKDLLLTE